jgi:hypothetical protein
LLFRRTDDENTGRKTACAAEMRVSPAAGSKRTTARSGLFSSACLTASSRVSRNTSPVAPSCPSCGSVVDTGWARTAAGTSSSARSAAVAAAGRSALRHSRRFAASSKSEEATGVAMSVRTSVMNWPPGMTNPMARFVAAPMPLESTSGTIPATNAKVVMRIGLNRSRLACRIAASRSMPRSRSWFAWSICRMEFFFTTPKQHQQAPGRERCSATVR